MPTTGTGPIYMAMISFSIIDLADYIFFADKVYLLWFVNYIDIFKHNISRTIYWSWQYIDSFELGFSTKGT